MVVKFISALSPKYAVVKAQLIIGSEIRLTIVWVVSKSLFLNLFMGLTPQPWQLIVDVVNSLPMVGKVDEALVEEVGFNISTMGVRNIWKIYVETNMERKNVPTICMSDNCIKIWEHYWFNLLFYLWESGTFGRYWPWFLCISGLTNWEDDWRKPWEKGTYYLSRPIGITTFTLLRPTLTPYRWRFKLVMLLLPTSWNLFSYFSIQVFWCKTYHLGKHTGSSFLVSQNPSSQSPFDLIHVNMWGAGRALSRPHFLYFLVIADDFF